MARVLGYTDRRIRIMVLPDGLFLTVPAGDLALPEEDETRINRELSALRWAASSGSVDKSERYDGQGNSYAVTVSGHAMEDGIPGRD